MSQSEGHGKLFIGGLSWDTTHESLLTYFSRFGEVSDCVVVINPSTQKSRGFGFVNFKDPSCVETVLAAGPHILDGKQIDPNGCNRKKLSKTDGKVNSRKKLFVGGLPPNIDEHQLRDAFNKYGPVNDVVIVYDQQKQKSRGFGFLTFDDEEIVERIVGERFIQISGKQVECKRAEPKDVAASHFQIDSSNMVLARAADGTVALVPASAVANAPAVCSQNPVGFNSRTDFAAHPELLYSPVTQNGVNVVHNPMGVMHGLPYVLTGGASGASPLNGGAASGSFWVMNNSGLFIAADTGHCAAVARPGNGQIVSNLLMPGGGSRYLLASNPSRSLMPQYIMGYNGIPQQSASEPMSPCALQLPAGSGVGTVYAAANAVSGDANPFLSAAQQQPVIVRGASANTPGHCYHPYRR